MAVVRRSWRALVAVALACSAAVASSRVTLVEVAEAHALHTTMSEVALDPRSGVLRIVIRLFAEDLVRAIALAQSSQPAINPASAALTYIRGSVVFTDGSRPLPLRFCGTRVAADVRWVCMETTVRPRASGLRLRNTLLTALFADQVNIVKSMVSGTPRSVLFTRGDGEKALP